jgi:4-hydroxythreonine-4-phosphate dehydrogenase
MSCRRLAITPGEPAGIGPDLVLQIAQQDWPHQLVVIADPALLRERAALLGCPSSLQPYDETSPPGGRALTVCPVPLSAAVVPGSSTQRRLCAGHLQRACDGNLSGELPPW